MTIEAFLEYPAGPTWATAEAPRRGGVARFCGIAAVLALALLTAASSAALLPASQRNWGAMVTAAVGLLCVWLIWRWGQPRHRLLLPPLAPALAAGMLVLLAQLVAHPHAAEGGRLILLGRTDPGLLVRLGVLALLLAVVQDVLGGVGRAGAVLTLLGLLLAGSASLELLAHHAVPQAPAVAASGLCGAALLLVPLWLPRVAHVEVQHGHANSSVAMPPAEMGATAALFAAVPPVPQQEEMPRTTHAARIRRTQTSAPPDALPLLGRLERAARIIAAAFVTLLIAGSNPKAAPVAAAALAAAASAVLLAGLAMPHRRARLVLAAAMVLAGALAALWRMDAQPFGPADGIALMPAGGALAVSPEEPGLSTLARAGGWAGAMLLPAGAAAGVLAAARRSRPLGGADQSRAAAAGAVAAVATVALLVGGGLSAPPALLASAIGWGAFARLAPPPRLALPRWALPALVGLGLLVLGLQTRGSSDGEARGSIRLLGDGGHEAAGFVLSLLLMWLLRCRSWWSGPACAAAAAALLAGGEPLQRLFSHRTADWADVAADALGAGAAAGVFLLHRALTWVEERMTNDEARMTNE